MGYDLQAVIGGEEVLRAGARELPAARLVPIGQGLALMPMTDELFDSVADGGDDRAMDFWRLPAGFAKTLADWSTAGPLAYVEAEYFGGVGEQTAVVWDGGATALGPLHEPEGRPTLPEGGPISQALRRLGAVAGAREDEFTAVGLDRHRSVEDWVA
ncbi:hypothetical protein AB0E78_35310 [Streptomyces sp. NPDC032198]|uniref:hypothetical protein n=1 Tax=Streptomyces sp. NPDC032198 TaxID=3155127 RepID=UPI0033EA4F0E